MTPWLHPFLGPIGPIPPRLCPKKVWRHFYDAQEHWERISDADVETLRLGAERVLGVDRARTVDLPALIGDPGHRARQILVQHHDTSYEPTYRREMASPDAKWTATPDSSHRHKVLTSRGVFAVVELDTPWSWVVTAFRPHPRIRSVEWSEEDILRHATWYFERETTVNARALERAVIENLQRVTAPADSISTLWWLASAVGYGRRLRDHAGVREALPAAETALATTSPSLAAALRDELAWDDSLDRLGGALTEPRPEDFEAALADAEELLCVADSLGATERAAEFVEHVSELIAWVPADWVVLLDRANDRLASFATDSSACTRMWTSVVEAAVSAAIRESAPRVRAEATLTDSVMAEVPLARQLRRRVAMLARSTTSTVAALLDQCLDTLNVARLAPTMSASDLAEDVSLVRIVPLTPPPHVRAFVVDEEHPAGFDVTDRFTSTDGDLWQLHRPDERGVVILVARDTPIAGESLEALLAAAEAGDGTTVRVREYQATQTTKDIR